MSDPPLVRRRSMTDFLAQRNPGVRDALLAAAETWLDELRQDIYQRKIREFSETLPKLTENDVAAINESDSSCPICLVPFSVIFAEEETSLALDSPAHPIEQLGVTCFTNTCGHVFCRKDALSWLNEGRTTCPMCRRPFIDLPPAPTAAPHPLEDVNDLQTVTIPPGFASMARAIMEAFDTAHHDASPDAAQVRGAEQGRNHNHDVGDQDQFSGMYS